MLLINLKRIIQKSNAGVLSSLHFPKSTNRSGEKKERKISRCVMCSIINYTGMMQKANMNTVCIFAAVRVQSLVLPKNWRGGKLCIKSTTASHL